MWYILNYIPPAGHRRSELPHLIRRYSDEIEVFAPTFIQLITEDGKVKKTEKPLLYHYIFVKGDEKGIKRLCMEEEGFSFVIDRTGLGRHLSLSDEAVEQFRIIARYYAGKLPCYPLDGISLEEGDKVEIVNGPCAGLRGTYISRKGGRSGNILIALDSAMAAIVYDVKADFVKVLEFARDSRRVYDQLDAFTMRILPFFSSRPPVFTMRDVANANVFITRLESVKLHNPKLDAKLQLLLYAAFKLLSRETEAKDALMKFEKLSAHVTNNWTKILVALILGDREAAQEQYAGIEQGKLSALQKAIVEAIK